MPLKAPPTDPSPREIPPEVSCELPCVIAQADLVSTQVLNEAAAIYLTLQRAAERRRAFHRLSMQDLIQLSIILTCGLTALFWSRLPTAFLLSLAIGVLVFNLWMIWSAQRDWSRRGVKAAVDLGKAAAQERFLIRELLPYSRASLLHAAATARAAENRVAVRLTLFLGANRAGGLVGGLLILLGAFSAGKYLQDQQLIIPLLGLPVTASGIIASVLLGYLFIAALLFVGHSVNALPQYAELLDRVAALKKNLAEDEKDAREREKTCDS